MERSEIEVSVVMPCLNEEETIEICVKKALESLRTHNIKGEVLVCDNGSTDKSVAIAKAAGAKVCFQPEKGYGNAYLKGFEEAKGRYIVMGDSDNTYDFSIIHEFLEPLKKGFDMVIGNRFGGKILQGAMPWLHRYIGNPFLSKFLNVLVPAGISDCHCGMRAFKKEILAKLHLQTTGMEFASEMIINAALSGIKIAEIPITYYPRKGSSKLHSFRDGWRHLRFMLLYSPTYLFMVPGVFLTILGFLIMLFFIFTPVMVLGVELRTYPIFGGSVMAILGYQIVFLGLFAKVYSLTEKFETEDKGVETLTRFFNLEKGIAMGLIQLLVGSVINVFVVYNLLKAAPDYIGQLRMAILAATLMILGVQTVFSSFLLSLLVIQRKH